MISGLLPSALLHPQQRLFPLDTPAIPAWISAATHNPMTRNGESYRIAGARSRDGARARRLADSAGHLAIGFRRAVWDRAQVLPYAPLECSRLYIERQLRQRAPSVKLFEHGSHPMPQRSITSMEGCTGKFAL
jgi:hypothetical protein